ncbi:MAG: hypothetical protein HKN77_03400 [Woeseiaceae bacterium]|nr:hypothetical protein [Woeseiaceae bacterium]
MRSKSTPGKQPVLIAALLLSACSGPVSESAERNDDLQYRVRYQANLLPEQQSVAISMQVSQSRSILREMRFPANGLTNIQGDGEVERIDGDIVWRPGDKGGELKWQVPLRNARGQQTYDAWLSDDWGLFRAEDMIPRAATRTLKSATAETSLAFDLPPGWSVVTEYAQTGDLYRISRPGRRFAQPAGWIVTGKLGVRRDTIAGVRVAVAAPENQNVRRMDMLALLHWTLPELAQAVPDMPERITVVSAGEPMWRGGLSAPQSIYVHADRPLISENGTSTLVHELMHVVLGLRGAPGYDWIVEGIAEYYSILLLQRSGTLSNRRFESAISQQAEWSKKAKSLCAPSSTGAATALAVITIAAVDAEIRAATAGDSTFDDVLPTLLQADARIDADILRAAVSNVAGQKSDALHADRLPGCSTLQSAVQTH